jgi:hypothetical protein
MQLLSRTFGRDRQLSRASQTYRPRHRNRALVGVESMEGRNLLSQISLQWGQINIAPAQASHNQTYVWNDGNNIDVWVNGEFAQFNSSQVYDLSYTGAQGGSDNFQNWTSLNTSIYANGGNNQLWSTGAFNTVYMYGGSNSYESYGNASDVFEYDTNDSVDTSYGNVYVDQINAWWIGLW